MNEIIAPSTRRTRVTVETLLDQLDQTIEAARADGQLNVVVNALTLSAKLVGLLRERIEVGGAGEFAGAKDAGEIMAMLVEELGLDGMIEMADRMREHAMAQCAGKAITVS
jgi:hypothetical protein